jgi:glycosyltransferase involved in cell wall biosynthesis
MLLKNLLVFPKGLWLARLIRRWEADHIHAHWAGTTATLAMVAARMSSTPWSFTAHRWDILENNALAAKAREASFVRFVSESGKALAASLKINDIERATKVIHMGVPVSQAFQTASASPVRPVIICPANLVPVKGHGYLLEALNILKHRAIVPEVWLAGDGELRPALEMRARQLNIADQVRFLGQVEHERLLDFYRNQRVQIIVLPSLELGKGVHEGIPVALIEAMSYGIPAISTQTGGIPELLQGGAGIMVPPADSVALANAIERLLMEPAERLRFGQAGMLRIRQSFSITTVIDQLTDLFLAGPTVKRS